jgi:hypothetical protein
MFGWFSAASVFASRSKRASRSGSCANVRQNLDSDLPTEIGIDSAPHFAHASRADLGGDFVRTDPGACSECHAIEQA